MSGMLSDVIKDYASALYATTPGAIQGRELANKSGNFLAQFLQGVNSYTGIDTGQIETQDSQH